MTAFFRAFANPICKKPASLFLYRFFPKSDRSTTALGGDCSILLSYGDMVIFFIISKRNSLMIFEGTFGLWTTCLSEKNK